MRIFSVIVLLSAFAASGCASMDERAAVAGTRSDASTQVDGDKVARINRYARNRGVKVIWVHMPRKKEPVAANG